MRPIIEAVRPEPDGFTRIFEVSASYMPGSLRVFWNGMARRAQDADGWVELGARRFEMQIAPEPGDVVQVYYLSI